MKLYHDLRNKNLFLSENDNMESYTEEEKNMIRLLKIFRILHHTNCIWRDWVKVSLGELMFDDLVNGFYFIHLFVSGLPIS